MKVIVFIFASKLQCFYDFLLIISFISPVKSNFYEINLNKWAFSTLFFFHLIQQNYLLQLPHFLSKNISDFFYIVRCDCYKTSIKSSPQFFCRWAWFWPKMAVLLFVPYNMSRFVLVHQVALKTNGKHLEIHAHLMFITAKTKKINWSSKNLVNATHPLQILGVYSNYTNNLSKIS